MRLTKLRDMKGRVYHTLMIWAKTGVIKSAVKLNGVWRADEEEVIQLAKTRRRGMKPAKDKCKCGGKHLAHGLCRRCYDMARAKYRQKRERELRLNRRKSK